MPLNVVKDLKCVKDVLDCNREVTSCTTVVLVPKYPTRHPLHPLLFTSERRLRFSQATHYVVDTLVDSDLKKKVHKRRRGEKKSLVG